MKKNVFDLLSMLERVIIILVVTEQIPSKTGAFKAFGSTWGCEGVKLCQHGTVFSQTSVGLWVLVVLCQLEFHRTKHLAWWVDLGYRLPRARLHSLADVIASYQRGISKYPVMTLLLNSLGYMGIALRLTDRELDLDRVLKNPTAVSFMRIEVSW